MTVVTLAAILLSVATVGLVCTRLTVSKLLLFGALLGAHIAACLFNYTYTLSHISDTSAYYYDPFYYWNQPWGLGTTFVTQVTHILRFGFGASYLDCFLFFQVFGLAGTALLARCFDDIEANVGVPERRGYWILLFLPSLHFWTVAIGKDAPLLFAISLCVWSMLNLRKRFVFFGLSILVMVLFRAHIALMAILSLGAATFFGSSASLGRKLGLSGAAFLGLLLVLGPVQDTIHADVTSASSVQDFLATQSQIGANFGGTTSIGDAPFPVKLLSLLFRPLFFDAIGIPGLVASVENILILLFFMYMVVRWRDVLFLARRVLFIRFVLVFAAMVLLSLALIYYNVGLGLRQRVMSYPMLFSLLVAVWSIRQKQNLAAAPQGPEHLMVNRNGHRALIEL